MSTLNWDGFPLGRAIAAKAAIDRGEEPDPEDLKALDAWRDQKLIERQVEQEVRRQAEEEAHRLALQVEAYDNLHRGRVLSPAQVGMSLKVGELIFGDAFTDEHRASIEACMYPWTSSLTDEQRAQLLPGTTWRHYKGGKYQILCVGLHTELEEETVSYCVIGGGAAYFRPVSMWFDMITEVDGKKLVEPVQRFTRL